MAKACIESLGADVLMHQSDHPHGQSFLPDMAREVMAWPMWSSFSEHALRQHIYDNAGEFLRLISRTAFTAEPAERAAKND